MNLRLLSLLVSLSLLGAACKSTGKTSNLPASGNNGEQAATAGGAGGNHSLPLQRLPIIKYPENEHVSVYRELYLPDGFGGVEKYQEVLHADGTGQFTLMLTGYAPNSHSAFGTPTQVQELFYEIRQRYLVHYRDVHIRGADRFFAGYTLEQIQAPHEVANRTCEKYVAHSKHGYGDVELLVDEDTRVLLNWAIYDAQGNEQMRADVTSVEYSPNQAGNFAWSQPIILREPYRPGTDSDALGFEPLGVDYRPAGFEAESWYMLLGEQQTLALPNIHLEVSTDGIRVLFVAQHRAETPQPSWNLNGLLITARRSKINGVRVLEAQHEDLNIFIVGATSDNEDRAVLGSMTQ